MKQAMITRLIAEERFGEASALLRRHLREAQILDPRRDDSWGIDADILGYAILEHRGVDDFAAYWRELLDFFVEQLEPEWGHLHKGHIYLRLGAARLAEDIEEAAAVWKQGLAEDRLVAESRRRSDAELDVEETVRDSPANVALCTALLVDRWPFRSAEKKRQFFIDLVPIRFDVIWGPQEVDPRRVQRAIRRVFQGSAVSVLKDKQELDQVFDARLQLAIMSTLERFLVNALTTCFSENLAPKDRRTGASLGKMLEVVERSRRLPAAYSGTVFRLVQILCDIFRYSQDFQIEADLTPRVSLQISVMLKILTDHALIRWAEMCGA